MINFYRQLRVRGLIITTRACAGADHDEARGCAADHDEARVRAADHDEPASAFVMIDDAGAPSS
jgi:tRNA splicing endonuclease